MPKWLKIVLIIGGALVLLCGLGVGAVAYVFNANKGQLKEKGERMMAEAREFARTSDSQGCLLESLKRLKADSGFMAEVEHRVFLGECLRKAPPTPSFCDGVPAMADLVKAALWANGACASYDGPADACGRMMQEVMKFCADHGKAPAGAPK